MLTFAIIVVIAGSTTLQNQYITSLLFVFGSLLWLWIVNRKCKKIIFINYGIKAEGLFWYDSKFHKEKVIEELRKHIDEEKLTPALSQIIPEIEKRAKDLKTQNNITKGIWGALFIPIWLAGAKWGFDYAGKNLSLGLTVFLFLIISTLCLIFIACCFNIVWGSLSATDYRCLKSLRNDLMDIEIAHSIELQKQNNE